MAKRRSKLLYRGFLITSLSLLLVALNCSAPCSGSITYCYFGLSRYDVLSPDVVFDEGTNGTAYVISTNKTWAEVNVTGTDTETYYEYVLNITNLSSSTNYQVKLENSSITGISRLTNFTVYFHDGSTLKQIEISSGSVTKSMGSWYSITASTIVYISLAIKVSVSGSSTVSLRLHAVKSDTTSPEVIQTMIINIT